MAATPRANSDGLLQNPLARDQAFIRVYALLVEAAERRDLITRQMRCP